MQQSHIDPIRGPEPLSLWMLMSIGPPSPLQDVLTLDLDRQLVVRFEVIDPQTSTRNPRWENKKKKARNQSTCQPLTSHKDAMYEHC